MNLRLAILAVRFGLGEITPRVWSDSEIIMYLNLEAQEMGSDLKCIQTTRIIQSVAGQQEYPLWLDFEEAIGISFLQGTQLKVMPVPQDIAQAGNYVAGTPTRYYIKQGTRVQTGIGASAVISVAQINDQLSRRARYVLGLWPVPSASGNDITMSFYQHHPWLEQDSDELLIPPPADRGVIAGATAQGKLKVSDMVSYATFKGVREQYMEKFLRKIATNANAEQPYFRSRPTDYEEDTGSNWIYVGPAGLSP